MNYIHIYIKFKQEFKMIRFIKEAKNGKPRWVRKMKENEIGK